MKKIRRRNLLKLWLMTLLAGYSYQSTAQSLTERHFVVIGDSWVGVPSVITPPLTDAWGGTANSFGYPGFIVPQINAQLSAQSFATQLAAQRPDAVVWTYGVNDYYQNEDPNAANGIGQGIKTTAALIQAAYPGVEMMFMLPAQTEGNGNPLHSWGSYQLAASSSAAQIPELNYVDMGDYIAPYFVGNPHWRNGSHLSALGYQTIFANVQSPIDVSGIPDAPTGLQVAVYSQTAAELFWQRMPGAVAYEVRRNGVEVATRDATSFYDDSLSPGSAYMYSVSAIDVFGNQSALSTVDAQTVGDSGGQPVDDQTRLDPITGLRSIVYSSTAVELFWDRSPIAGLQYDVFRNGVKIGSSNGVSYYDPQFNRASGAVYVLVATDPQTGLTSPEAQNSIEAVFR